MWPLSTPPRLSLGTNSITATYEGDTNYVGSTSAVVTVTVVQSATPPSGSFQLVTSPTINGSLIAVSSVSPTDIWAVGFQNTSTGVVAPLTENFNGTSWSVVAAPTPAGSSVAEFTSVSAVASNNVWAVGFSLSVVNNENVSTPLVEHYNGTSWSIQTTPATGGKLNAVTAVSATDVWAVGGTGSADLIENFNGTTWSIVQAPSPPTAIRPWAEFRRSRAPTSSPLAASEKAISRKSCNLTVRRGPRSRIFQPALPTPPSTRSLPPTSGPWAAAASGISTGRAGPRSPRAWVATCSPSRALGQRYLRRRRDHLDHG